MTFAHHAGQDICTQGKAADRMWVIEEGGVIALQYARRDPRYPSDSGKAPQHHHHHHAHHHATPFGQHHHHAHAALHALGSWRSHRAVSLRALRSQSMPLGRTGRRPKSKAQAHVDVRQPEVTPRQHVLGRAGWSNKTEQKDSDLSSSAAAAAAAAAAGTGVAGPLSLTGEGNMTGSMLSCIGCCGSSYGKAALREPDEARLHVPHSCSQSTHAVYVLAEQDAEAGAGSESDAESDSTDHAMEDTHVSDCSRSFPQCPHAFCILVSTGVAWNVPCNVSTCRAAVFTCIFRHGHPLPDW
jgi:hypothetical protein